LVLLPGLVAGAPRVAAQPATGWTFEPATITGATTARTFFDYSVSAGDAIQDYVRLSNATNHDLTFTLYGADAYTTEQGAFALRLRDQPRDGVGAWVSLPFTTRTVPAGTAITFPFQLGVPHDVEPGDWAGGVVAVATDPSTPAPAANVKVEQGVGARIYVRVKGPLHPALSVTRLDAHADGGTWAPLAGQQHASFAYEITNTGNVRLAGNARLEIVDAFGRTMKTFPIRALPELLPHESTSVAETWDGAPLLSTGFRPRLVVQADGVETTREASALWRVSVPATGAAIVLFFLVVVLARFLARKLSRLRHRTPAVVAA